MSNVEIIRFLINEANQLTADTPKKVRKYTIDLLVKAVQEAAGLNVDVRSSTGTELDDHFWWQIVCEHSCNYNVHQLSRVTLVSFNVANSSLLIPANWDNAADVLMEAIKLVSKNERPYVSTIREDLNSANTPKFDPEQAIWDAGGWTVSKYHSASIVGECTKAYIEYGGMGYIAERDPDAERVLTSIGPIKNPRHVDTDRYRVIAVLPNRVYVAKKNGTDSWVVFTKDSMTSGTVYYCYSSAVENAIKFSQETS